MTTAILTMVSARPILIYLKKKKLTGELEKKTLRSNVLIRVCPLLRSRPANLFSTSAGFLIHRKDSFCEKRREQNRKGREGTVAEKGAVTWREAGWLRLAAARLPFLAIKIRNEIVASRSGVSRFLGVIL